MRPLTIPLSIAATLAMAAPAGAAPQPVDLELIGRTAPLGEARAEIADFHKASKRLFSTNSDQMQVNVDDLTDPTAPVALPPIDTSSYGGGSPTSVAVTKACGGRVAVAIPGPTEVSPGTVEFFTPTGTHIESAPAGVLPDMLTFAPDGRTLLVANEAQPATDGSFDPKGSVTRIQIGNCAKPAFVTQIPLTNVLLDPFVRIFDGVAPAKDLEPEYITVAPNGTTAYVSMQENNAIGVLDIAKGKFTAIKGMGYKDWGATPLDPVDRGGIALGTFPGLKGMYMPDAIAAYEVGGETYIATANEGDAREYDFLAEEVRVSSSSVVLDPTAFPNAATLKGASVLGRLNITNTMGDTDDDGDYDELYTFGGRSMSILDASGSLAWDSGSFLEQWTAANDAANFNKSNAAGSPVDDRSDNKGPEPEGVATGIVAGRPYAFLANERNGGLFAFDLQDTPGQGSFAGHINTREDDLGPEGVRFLSGQSSPTGKPVVVVTNEISGTVALYSVKKAAPAAT
ncbi:choice-of-anchor I family protein [Svornostia abyssi]|uniref:Choice-of-anchor I family protein n=1 Tax=Svornostia abyssi TaxID=2898438 RepID=A0ABY5PIV0_9ACTN|nr:choice-of-anchor I family protein [Parviterribacteraceae bacterium J379]